MSDAPPTFDPAAAHAGLAVIEWSLRTHVAPQLENPPPTSPIEATAYTLYARVALWCGTIVRLDQPGDFQALASGARALLETCVDLALLVQDRRRHLRMLAWEESARWEHAADIVRHHRGTVPDEDRVIQDEYASNKARILALRKTVWGNAKHPTRWFGRTFEEAVREADRALNHSFPLLDIYEKHHSLLCWNIHGSTGIPLRGVPPSAHRLLCGYAYLVSAQFAVLTSRLSLELMARSTESLQERLVDAQLACDELLTGTLSTKSIDLVRVVRPTSVGTAVR